VKEVVDTFISARENDRIGIIVFGSKAYLQLPFTRDLSTARKLLELTEVAMAGPHTALGDAIGLSIRSFEESNITERILVLLTDGNDTSSKMTPLNAAEIAARRGVEIYTIGIGDPGASGEDRVDFKILEDISARTGGEFHIADDKTTLTDIYQRIDDLNPAEVKTETWRPRTSVVHWPIGFALCFAFLAYSIMLLRLRA
jgi:Ca-activated chloride channel family protein